jgi:hypothetical protein
LSNLIGDEPISRVGSTLIFPRIAVAGCGCWPARHPFVGLLSFMGAELAGIVNPNPNRATAVGDEFDVRGFEALDELLAVTCINGMVWPPLASFCKIACHALQAGLHVTVERHTVARASESFFARCIAVVVVSIDRWTSGRRAVLPVVLLS